MICSKWGQKRSLNQFDCPMADARKIILSWLISDFSDVLLHLMEVLLITEIHKRCFPWTKSKSFFWRPFLQISCCHCLCTYRNKLLIWWLKLSLTPHNILLFTHFCWEMPFPCPILRLYGLLQSLKASPFLNWWIFY